MDEVSDCMRILERQGFARPLVHLIDREGDFSGHIRLWESTGSHWLVRVKDNPKVDYECKAMACKAVAQKLAFIKTRPVSYLGNCSCVALPPASMQSMARLFGSGWRRPR